MTQKLTLIVFLVLIGGAFVLGWYPEHQQRMALYHELKLAQAKSAASEFDIRLCRLEDQLISLLDLVDAKNYGAAQNTSSAFFDGIRAEAAAEGPGQAEFSKILSQRDDVTAALARNDPTVAGALRALRAPLMQLQTKSPSGAPATTP